MCSPDWIVAFVIGQKPDVSTLVLCTTAWLRKSRIEFAGEVKVNDLTLFLACLDGSDAHESIEGEWRLAERLKVTGTPTLLVNGQRFEGVPSLVQLDSVVLARLRQ